MDEENKINEPVEQPVAPTEPVVEPPKAEVPPTNGMPNNDNPNPPKKGHAGAIIATIVIVALIAAVVALSVVLLNKDDDEDSDKKSSKKENTTNSAVIENEIEDEDENTTSNKTKGKEEDEDDDEDIVEAGGIEFLADYSAFNFDIDTVIDCIEDNMLDPDETPTKKGNKYEIECNDDIYCTVEVDKNGNVTKVDFHTILTEENYSNAGYQLGYNFGYFVGKLGYDDITDVQDQIKAITEDQEEHMTEPTSFPTKMFENYVTREHSRFQMEMTATSQTQIETHFFLVPSKKATESKY